MGERHKDAEKSSVRLSARLPSRASLLMHEMAATKIYPKFLAILMERRRRHLFCWQAVCTTGFSVLRMGWFSDCDSAEPRSCFSYAVGAHYPESRRLRQPYTKDGEHDNGTCILPRVLRAGLVQGHCR